MLKESPSKKVELKRGRIKVQGVNCTGEKLPAKAIKTRNEKNKTNTS